MSQCESCPFAVMTSPMPRAPKTPKDLLFVFLAPITDTAASVSMDVIKSMLHEFKIDEKQTAITSILRCQPIGKINFTKDKRVAAMDCMEEGFLEDLIETCPKAIVAFGGDVVNLLTGEKAVTKVNGQICDFGDYKVVPSVSPVYVIESNDREYSESMMRSTFQTASDILRGKVKKVTEKQYIEVSTMTQFEIMMKQILSEAGPFVIDYENYPLKPWYDDSVLLSVAITNKVNRAWGLLIDHPDAKWTDLERTHIKKRLAEWCTTNTPKIAANAKHEIIWTREILGVELINIVGDPIALDYLEDENRPHDVGTMAQRYTNMGGYEHEMDAYWYNVDGKGKKPDYRKAPGDKLLKYNMQDVDVELVCYNTLKARADKKLLKVHDEILIPAAYTLAIVEKTGWAVDKGYSETLITNHDIKIVNAIQTLRGYEVFDRFEKDQDAPFNFDSSPQKMCLFFGWDGKNKRKFDDPLKRYLDMEVSYDFLTDTGQPSTNKNWRAANLFIHPFISDYDDYLKLWNLKKNFLTPLPEYLNNKDQRIHTDYNASKVVSGRLSSIDPNTQNFPDNEDFWAIFISRFKNGKFVKADYGQVELRVLAWLAKDANMIRTFKNSEDIHVNTAKDFMRIADIRWLEMTDEERHEYRQMGKRFNFAVANNRGAHHLALDLTAWQRKAHPGVDMEPITDAQAQEYLDAWYKPHRSILKWKEAQITFAHKHGYVESPFGYRRRAIDLKSTDKAEKARAERMLISFLMQNTAAVITLVAMNRVLAIIEENNFDTVVVGSCYDALYFDSPPDEVYEFIPLLVNTMQKVGTDYNMPIPLAVDVGSGPDGGHLEKWSPES